ncbi:MAG: regulatory protein RecX [Ruminococcaceae bacterium]|nr:regulatory protein RecX [Oscillospiraceae bacterium]MBQ9914209.1 regulatory protein RecX [Clostridia bacterium]
MKLNFKEGKGDKIHVLVDGEYYFTVDRNYFAVMGIYQGKEVEKDELALLGEQAERRRAYNCAVGYLSRRDHSSAELLLKLRQKGYRESAEYAVEKLRNEGYVDDERFARMYVRELINVKKYGRKRVVQELYRKGVDREVISLVLEETHFDESDLCALISRKYLRYLSDEKGIKKTVAALMRMGYSFSEIKSALGRIAEDEEYNFEVSDE